MWLLKQSLCLFYLLFMFKVSLKGMAQTGFDLELEQLTLSKIQDKFFGHMQSLFKKRNFQCFSMKKYRPDTNVAFSFQ